MIRRTVARAFGFGGEERPRMEKALPDSPTESRSTILNGLFQALQEAFERAAGEEKAARPEAGPPAGEEGAASAAGAAPVVSKVRPRPDGLEFVVDGAGASLRFLNSMDGIIRIFRDEGGRYREERLITIQLEGSRARVIERTPGLQRAPFRFTSVPQVVREFLRELQGKAR